MSMVLQRFAQRLGLSACSCLILSLVLFSLAACGGSTTSGTTAGTNTKSPLTVWVDSARLPGFQLYQTRHPNVKLNILVVDRSGNDLPEKILLDNRAGSGWPDVVFAEPNLIAGITDRAHHSPS